MKAKNTFTKQLERKLRSLGVYQMALENMNAYYSQYDLEVNDFLGAFSFESNPQGFKFWNSIDDQMKDMK